MTITEIYVALIDEGLSVWRQAPAHRIDQDTYVLLHPDDYDPEAETWEFPPGSVVTCENRILQEGPTLVARQRVQLPDRQSA